MITLATLPQATAQEVFDQVATHLLEQGEKCTNGQVCLYRYDGKKCAAGCLIGDDEYHPGFAAEAWPTLIGKNMVADRHRDLIMTLQNLHDQSDPEEWHDSLSRLAKREGLKFNDTSKRS